MFRSFMVGALCALSTTFITAVTAKGAGFQPNDIVVVRTQKNGSLGSAVAVELDEYASSGSQSSPINVVTFPSSGSNKLTVGGSDQFVGALKLSGDGKYLTLGGLDANAGTVNVGGELSASNRAVVGRVTVSNGTIDLSTKIDNAPGTYAHYATVYSAVTSNGTDIWLTGGVNEGVNYTTLGSSTVARVNQSLGTQFRTVVGIFGGQLYSSSANTDAGTPPYPITSIGSGLPTTPAPETVLPGMPTDGRHATIDFWFRDANTLYLTEEYPTFLNPGVQKWTFNGTSWQYQYNVFTSPVDYLSGWVDPSRNTVLFATTGAANDSLLRIVDGGSQALSTSSNLATAAAGTSFRGVAFISVPEPASFAIMALGASALFFVARRRKMTTTRIAVGALCVLLTTLITAATAKGAGFQPNDIVVLRALSNTVAAAVELDEYTSSGFQASPINFISIPSSGSDKLTISGTSQAEGVLKLSGDGNYLTLVGAGVNTTTAVVGRVNISDGASDLSTKINVSNAGPFGELFSAVTSNGTDIWTTQATGRIYYTTLGSSTVTRVNQSADFTTRSVVGIFGGQLYRSFSNSSPSTINSVGSGLPTVSSLETPLPGLVTAGSPDRSNDDFWFRDANTLYLTESSSSPSHPGIQKWSFVGSTWQYQYNVSTSPINYLSGWVDPSGNTVLFATYGLTNDKLLRIVDGGSQSLSSSSVLATAPSGTSFRDVAFIASVPEPSSLLLMALGGLALPPLIRLRRRRAAIKS